MHLLIERKNDEVFVDEYKETNSSPLKDTPNSGRAARERKTIPMKSQSARREVLPPQDILDEIQDLVGAKMRSGLQKK